MSIECGNAALFRDVQIGRESGWRETSLTPHVSEQTSRI